MDRDAQEAIQQGTQDIIRGYPLAAGLTSVADVVNHLDIPRPYPPSLFPPASTLSLEAGPDEPLFRQYQGEIAALLAPGQQSAEVEQWRRQQLARAAEVMRDDIGAFSDPNYGRVSFPQPAYPLPPNCTPGPPPPTSAPPPLATQFLDSVGFPYPSALPPSAAIPTPPPTNPHSIAESTNFFRQYLASQKQVRESARRPSTPPPPPTRQLPTGLVPESSPDPLQISSQPNSQPNGAGPGPRSSLATTFNGVRYASNGSSSTVPPSDPFIADSAPTSGSPNLFSDAATPRRAAPNGHGSFGAPEHYGQSSEARKLTESQRAASLGTPVTLGSESGVESAVKRIKLGASGTAPSTNGTGRGTVKAGGSKDIVERFSDVVSDLFSADDSYIIDTSSSHLGPPKSPGSTALDFFRTTTTTTDNLPLLKTDFIRKLIKQLGAVKLQGKGEELLEEVEEGGLARLLKILERSWRGVEDLELWPAEALEAKKKSSEVAEKGKGKKGADKGKGRGSVSPKKRGRSVKEDADEEEEGDDEVFSPASKGRGRSTGAAASRRSSRSRSRSPAVVEMDLDVVGEDAQVWTDETLDDFARSLRSLSDALLAIRAALAILTITTLSKSLYSADYIISLLVLLRHTLDAFLFPLLEALLDSHLGDLGALQAQEIGGVCESITSGIPLVSALVQQEEMSEDIVISAIYFSLSPYFHEEAPQAGKGKKVDTNAVERAMKGIRIASLGLTRTVFARYPDQRGWIIEEVLGNLTKLEIAKKGKGAFRLRNGAAIHTASALILHLVQTAPANLRSNINAKILEHGKPKLAEDVEMRDSQQEELDADNEDETTTALTGAIRDLLHPAIESANQSARMVVNYLLQKSCKSGKAASGSTEAEYRAVFDNLINDLLATLHLSEWPASELILTVCCKSMMSSLSDPKSTHELNALKGLSLDHVGSIAARIRQDRSSASHWPALRSLPEIVSSADVSALEQLYASQQQLFAHLVRTDKAEGASEFVASVFGGELANALVLSTSLLSKSSEREQNESEEDRRAKALNTRLSTLAISCWAVEVDDDIFGPSAEDEQPTIDGIALQLACSRPLAALYEPLLDNIVNASDSSAVGFRTKALRDIGLVVAQDPELFHQANVRKSIESRMHDSSPAVRDAAIELVGKYVVSRPDLASEYLPQICERITDTGLSVRRRVVKLLKALFSVVEHEHERVEICRKLVWRAIDDDEGIKELAVETVEDLWFSRTLPSSTDAMVNDESQAQNEPSKSGIAQLANIIMSVAGEYRDRPPPVDELLRAIISKHAEKGTKPPVGRLREVIETLIDSLVEDEETNLVTTIKTIHVLNAADLGLLSASKAQTLIPFLKSASTPQDQLIGDYLLKIFRSTVSSMPKSSSKMGKELQAALTPMINKPPPSLPTLQEIVACFCAVILGQTHDFGKLISFFRTTTQRLAGEIRKLLDPATQASANVRSLPTLCHLASLLCENGLFDSVRAKYPETKAAFDSISPKPISEYIYTLLVKVYSLPVGPQVQSSALNSLGFLFRAYPTLMLNPSSTSIMDSVFKTGTSQSQLQLLKILQDFLTSQAKASTVLAQRKAEKGVKIDELVGNVDGFADSGVASAVSQRYIDQILSASVSTSPQVQRVAVDILTSVARSGFSHPLAISPTLVALTTSADSQIASKGYATLSLLHQKHASLLATRFAEPAKTAHAYARAVAGQEVVHGYREDPTLSHFGRWYSLLQKEKRTLQHDYLKTISRMFEMEPGAPCSQDDVSLARYVAEALSTLEFKRLEEPMIIISYLNSALAVAGLQVLHLLELDIEGGVGLLAGTPTSSPTKRGRSQSGSPVKRSASLVQLPEPMAGENPAVVKPPAESLARQSLICGLALLLRDHLKCLYSLTEAKLAKFVVGKKSAHGDRAAVRRAEAPLALGEDSYERLPFAISPMKSDEELIEQRDMYINLIAMDGTIGALDELAAEEEE